MAGEIATFVAKHKAKLFPPGESKKPPVTKRPGSVGELGKSLEDNDPETLKFIKRHDTTIQGEKPEVATKYALDNPINSHMKPETGVYEGEWQGHEEEEMEEVTENKCPKCGSEDCNCQHEECGSKKLKSKKLKEETLANFIALDVLEEMKAERLDELSKQLMGNYVGKAIDSKKKAEKPGFISRMMGAEKDPKTASNRRQGILRAARKIKDPNKTDTYGEPTKDPSKLPRPKSMYGYNEGVGEIHKVSPGDPDYTGGMHIGLKPKAENQTDHKPVVASSEKSKKLAKKEVKEGHADPMPHLNNPSHGSGCTGHEDPRPTIKKPHADPTKIPNTNQVPNSTQPASGVLDKKKKR